MKCVRVLLASATAISIAAGLSCADIIGITDVPDGASGDAQSDAAPDADASIKCNPTDPFTGPAQAVGLPSDGIVAFAVSPDELTAYLCEGASDGGLPSLASASRSSADASFGPVQAYPNSTGVCRVTVSGDNQGIVWTHYDTSDAGAQTSHLRFTTRMSTTQPFAFPATPIDMYDGGEQDDPYLRADGARLYFLEYPVNAAPQLASSNKGDLYRDQTAVSGPPTLSSNPVVTVDDRVLYYTNSSDQIVFQSRVYDTDPFANKKTVVDASPPNEAVSAVQISADNCRLYYSSQVTTYDGGFPTGLRSTLYVLHRTPQ